LDFAVELHGTAFQEAVWAEIAKLGFGKVATYADIASAIGNPKAVRAVGGAVGSNPVPLVVGCHRVLGASKKITGYSGGEGIPTKKWLLAHESIEYRD
jgi:methylated-DNA-[protein]-cysteine S-methyltransferase